MALEQLSCKKKKYPFEGLFRNLPKLFSKMGGNRKSLLVKNKKISVFKASWARKMIRNKTKGCIPFRTVYSN